MVRSGEVCPEQSRVASSSLERLSIGESRQPQEEDTMQKVDWHCDHARHSPRARRRFPARRARQGRGRLGAGDLPGHRADARLGAGILQGVPGSRHRRRLGGVQIGPAQSEDQARRQDQGADRARGRGADPLPVLHLFPHRGRQGERRDRRGDPRGRGDGGDRAPLEHGAQRHAGRSRGHSSARPTPCSGSPARRRRRPKRSKRRNRNPSDVRRMP